MVCSSYAWERSTTSPAGNGASGLPEDPPHPKANSDTVAQNTSLDRIDVLMTRILAHAIGHTAGMRIASRLEGRPLPCGVVVPLRHGRELVSVLRKTLDPFHRRVIEHQHHERVVRHLPCA